ncbi:TAPT1-like protein [Rhizoctonia solani]|uniref:TAPT1-like protein n=1 Tax=Rhizoctonia solani TaxID=456999 RepID=A0A8H8P203_9AGAM|nr:TAPT1-like protein [Rhizoctonia solani]QRW24271.1 TAPT1-like protein [Rhizoctonia solani]
MPSTSTRRTVSPLRRVTPTNSDARNLRARRSTSSSSATPSKAKNPDYGRFTPLASQPQTISSNAGNAPSELSTSFDLEPLPVPVVTSKSTPLLEERMTDSQTRVCRSELRIPEREVDHEPFSLWDYLREELLATDFDSHRAQVGKSQQLPEHTDCYRKVLHSLVLVYQLISLNVAINSYDNALLTLLISNQFVEIKGSVFKKFEKDNLFQITCADIVERFQLSSMLLVIALRNTIELSSDSFDLESSGLPQSFKVNFLSGIGGGGSGPSFRQVAYWGQLPESNYQTASDDGVAIGASGRLAQACVYHEVQSHPPSVYERYTDVLCRDLLASGSRRRSQYIRRPIATRRSTSWPSYSAACCTRSSHWFPAVSKCDVAARMELDVGASDAVCSAGGLIWLCLVTIKLMLGVNLLVYATSRKKYMDTRVQEDEDVNKFGRNPIGEGKEEQGYNRELKTLLNRKADDAGGGAARKKVALEDLTRFTMVKRIW